MKTYQVIVRVCVPDVAAENKDDAINYVTEAIDDRLSRATTLSESGQAMKG